jgi:sn-glycerol 3-phosphate transport system substrate-binding protein
MAGAASLLAALALVAAGCGGKFNDSSGSGSDGQDVPDASALDKASGVTKITFWHGNIKQT